MRTVLCDPVLFGVSIAICDNFRGGFAIVISIWVLYGFERAGSNFDLSLTVYRSSPLGPDTALFNLSGTVFPPNGTFSFLETIPSSLLSLSDTHCLSAFEYRSQDSLVFYNTIEVIPVSADGKFCTTRSGLSSSCYRYYLRDNLRLFYGFVDPTFLFTDHSVEEFHSSCLLIGYHIRPNMDLSINVSSHINRKEFPTNDEELVVYYPILRLYALFSDILASGAKGLDYNHPPISVNNGTLYCALRLYYNIYDGVVYNYLGMWTDSSALVSSNQLVSLFFIKQQCSVISQKTHVLCLIPSALIFPMSTSYLSMMIPTTLTVLANTCSHY